MFFTVVEEGEVAMTASSGYTNFFDDGRVEHYDVSRLLHRVNGPAVIDSYGQEEYWVDGKLHRVDGPAIVDANGRVEYWVDGKLVSKRVK